ncbi:MAG TPA: hypothetical protein VFY44_03300 [Thermoleophilaceae bacterium]|nr:hypothetical protein [Thermoleophilaceae bacterium]
MSVALERGLYHLLLVPAIGIAGSWMTDWNWWTFVAIDTALSVAYEVARVGVAGVTIGVKDMIPVLIMLRIGLPTPTRTGLIVAGILLAALAAEVGWYLLRRRIHPAVHVGRHWRRPALALAAVLAAVMVGLFAAGMSLMAPQVGPLLALGVIPPAVAAYHFQTPPRRGGSRTRSVPTVLTRVRDKTPQTALVGGVR